MKPPRFAHLLGAAAFLALILAFVVVAFGTTERAAGGPAQQETAIGIDAEVTGNEAAALGPIDPCVTADRGDTVQVDFYVDNVTDLLAWETYIAYDGSILEIIDREVGLFLESGGGTAFDASESVPDHDGLYRFSATDTASTPAPDSGSGVLGRLTLKAIGKGVSLISTAPQDRNQDDRPDIGPVLKDVDNNLIGDSDGDTFFDGTIVDAKIAVDSSCDEQPGESTAADGAGDDGDIEDWWWVAVIIGGVILAAAAAGAVALRARRGAGPPSGNAGGQP